MDPSKVYKKSWKGWSDFLSTSKKSDWRNIANYSKAKKIIKKYKLNSNRDFNNLSKTGKKPVNIPSNPNRAYKNKGWKGWKDFLGTG